MGKQELTQERLKEVLHYDPETGVFTWKVTASSRAVVGRQAGYRRPDGYQIIGIDQTQYYGHRLAWLYTHGVFPTEDVDHRNGVRGDDRLVNLRPCTRAENCQNRAKRPGTKSDLVGAHWSNTRKAWESSIVCSGVVHKLGVYTSPEDAHQAYLAAKAQLHTFQPTPRTA